MMKINKISWMFVLVVFILPLVSALNFNVPDDYGLINVPLALIDNGDVIYVNYTYNSLGEVSVLEINYSVSIIGLVDENGTKPVINSKFNVNVENVSLQNLFLNAGVEINESGDNTQFNNIYFNSSFDYIISGTNNIEAVIVDESNNQLIIENSVFNFSTSSEGNYRKWVYAIYTNTSNVIIDNNSFSMFLNADSYVSGSCNRVSYNDYSRTVGSVYGVFGSTENLTFSNNIILDLDSLRKSANYHNGYKYYLLSNIATTLPSGIISNSIFENNEIKYIHTDTGGNSCPVNSFTIHPDQPSIILFSLGGSNNNVTGNIFSGIKVNYTNLHGGGITASIGSSGSNTYMNNNLFENISAGIGATWRPDPIGNPNTCVQRTPGGFSYSADYLINNTLNNIALGSSGLQASDVGKCDSYGTAGGLLTQGSSGTVIRGNTINNLSWRDHPTYIYSRYGTINSPHASNFFYGDYVDGFSNFENWILNSDFDTVSNWRSTSNHNLEGLSFNSGAINFSTYPRDLTLKGRHIILDDIIMTKGSTNNVFIDLYAYNMTQIKSVATIDVDNTAGTDDAIINFSYRSPSQGNLLFDTVDSGCLIFHWSLAPSKQVKFCNADTVTITHLPIPIQPYINLVSQNGEDNNYIAPLLGRESSSVDFNFTYFTSSSNLTSCNFLFDDVIRDTHLYPSSYVSNVNNLFTRNIQLGSHEWRVRCNNAFGESKDTSNWTLSLNDEYDDFESGVVYPKIFANNTNSTGYYNEVSGNGYSRISFLRISGGEMQMHSSSSVSSAGYGHTTTHEKYINQSFLGGHAYFGNSEWSVSGGCTLDDGLSQRDLNMYVTDLNNRSNRVSMFRGYYFTNSNCVGSGGGTSYFEGNMVVKFFDNGINYTALVYNVSDYDNVDVIDSVFGNVTFDFSNPTVLWYTMASAGSSSKSASANAHFYFEEMYLTSDKTDVILNNPEQNKEFNYTVTSVELNYTPTPPANVTIYNCSLIINDVFNKADQSIENETINQFTLSVINGTSYVWEVSCEDSANEIITSAPRQFSVINQEAEEEEEEEGGETPSGGAGEQADSDVTTYTFSTIEATEEGLSDQQIVLINGEIFNFIENLGTDFTNLDLLQLQQELANEGVDVSLDYLQNRIAQSLPSIDFETDIGGGGSSIKDGFPQDESADSGLFFDVKEVILNPDRLAFKITLTNNGDESINPSYTLLSPDDINEKDGTPFLILKGKVDTILPGDTQSFYVLMKDLPRGVGEFSSYLRVGIDGFKDLQLPIKIRTATGFSSELFGGGFKGFLFATWDSMKSDLFFIGSFGFKLGYLSAIIGIAIFGLVYASPLTRKNIFALISFPIFVSFLITSVIAQII